MPLPTTFAGDSSRGAGQWTGSYGTVSSSYWMTSYEDSLFVSPQTEPSDTISNIVVDSSKNVYTAGYASGVPKIFVTKQTPTGTFSWAVSISAGGVNGIQTNGIAVDSAGNVYVTSYGGNRGYVQKLNSSGALVYSYQIYNASGATALASVAIDSSDNVYLGGFWYSGGPCVIKLNSSGTWQWGVYYNGGSGASGKTVTGLAIDSAGRINCAVSYGQYGGGVSSNFQLSSSGSFNWSNTLIPTGYSSIQAYGVTVDSSNNVYFNTQFVNSGNTYYGIAKVASNGTAVWAQGYLTSASNGVLWGFPITSDSSGNLYVTGYNSGYAALKFDSSGNFVCSAVASVGNLTCVALDNSGNTYWGGSISTTKNDGASKPNYAVDALLIKDTNSFASTHAGTFTLNSFTTTTWGTNSSLSSTAAYTGGSVLTGATANSFSSSSLVSVTTTVANVLGSGITTSFVSI